jgi:hypothetical protein
MDRQGYARCIELYEGAGVNLAAAPVVGVGSVCRRQSTAEIGEIMAMLAANGIRTHGFGVKKAGVARYGRLLSSADSMAWSYNARRSPPLAGCTHKRCSNCLRFALAWREEVLAREQWLALDLDDTYEPIAHSTSQPRRQRLTPTGPRAAGENSKQLQFGFGEHLPAPALAA